MEAGSALELAAISYLGYNILRVVFITFISFVCSSDGCMQGTFKVMEGQSEVMTFDL